jgi:hypothetical protein
MRRRFKSHEIVDKTPFKMRRASPGLPFSKASSIEIEKKLLAHSLTTITLPYLSRGLNEIRVKMSRSTNHLSNRLIKKSDYMNNIKLFK